MPRQGSLLSFFRKDRNAAPDAEQSQSPQAPKEVGSRQKLIESITQKLRKPVSNETNSATPSKAETPLRRSFSGAKSTPSSSKAESTLPAKKTRKPVSRETDSVTPLRVEAPLVPGTKRVRDDYNRASADPSKRQKLLEALGDAEDLKQGAWSEAQAKFEWMHPSKILDGNGRKFGDPLFDKRTIQIPPEVLKKMSASQRQYWTTKSQYMDVLLFFKVGKFYELYELDAEIGHKELDWKMTLSGVGKCRQVGVPESGIDDAVQKLVARGYKVGRMEQIETSEQAKARRGSTAMVERELVQVITPSTLTEGAIQPEAVHLLAVKEVEEPLQRAGSKQVSYGFAFADAAAGRCYVGSFSDNDAHSTLNSLLMQVSPQEILYEQGGISGDVLKLFKSYTRPGLLPMALTPLQPYSDFSEPDVVLEMINSRKYFQEYVNNEDPGSWPKLFDGIDHLDAAASALGALLSHLHRIKMDAEIPNGVLFVHEIYKGSMRLDGQTIANLELLENTANGSKIGSLLGYLDSCMTSFGKRLLRRWICHPLQDVNALNRRLDAVEEFLQNAEGAGDVRGRLRTLPDLERLVARIRGYSENSSCEVFLPLAKKAYQRRVKTFCLVIQGFEVAYEILECLRGMPVTSQLLRSACELLDAEAPVERLRDIKAYLNDGKLSMDVEPESDDEENKSLSELMLEFNEHKSHWAGVVEALSSIDVLLAFAAAKISAEGPTCRPVFLPVDSSSKKGGSVLEMKGVWHPFAAAGMGGAFVPNDVQLGSGKPRAMLLTGPNMGGKSTLLRATCLAALMAQLGCFVPSESCRLTPVDTIFTRIGARDRIMSGESTFMVECTEAGSILRHASCHSLVVLDELGRGTSTFDGYAIAYAVFRHLVEELDCRLLFATHYHPLTDEFSGNPSVSLQHMACTFQGSQLVFLYKLLEGPCPRSYGLQVALLAGIPVSVVEAASEARKLISSRSCPWSRSDQNRWIEEICSSQHSRDSLIKLWSRVRANLVS